MGTDFDQLRNKQQRFVTKRDWNRFHTPQNLAMAISVESNELLENFLWLENLTAQKVQNDEELLNEIRDEMADVLIYLIGLENQLGVDLLKAAREKIERNEERFDKNSVEEFNIYLDN